MRKTVQILLLAALLLPLVGDAREETLEERKTRITRKYLRKRMSVAQSGLYVPSDLPEEDERVLESEKYKELEKDALKKSQETTRPMPLPVRRLPIREQQDSNWLLDGASEDEMVDLFADPFATTQPDDSSSNDRSYWSGQRNDDEQSESRYNPYSSRDQGRSGSSSVWDGRNDQQGYGTYGRQTTGMGTDNKGSAYSGGELGSKRTYGATPDSGLLLDTPYPQIDSQDPKFYRRSDTEEEKRPGSYTPYKSPYQTRREQQQQKSWSGVDSSTKKQEYQKPSTVEQWKSRNKAYDPTADDAYINEMMKSDRR
jgi:hypothetical protein